MLRQEHRGERVCRCGVLIVPFLPSRSGALVERLSCVDGVEAKSGKGGGAYSSTGGRGYAGQGRAGRPLEKRKRRCCGRRQSRVQREQRVSLRLETTHANQRLVAGCALVETNDDVVAIGAAHIGAQRHVDGSWRQGVSLPAWGQGALGRRWTQMDARWDRPAWARARGAPAGSTKRQDDMEAVGGAVGS